MWPAFLPWLLCLLLVAGWLIEKWSWRKKERACRQEAETLQRLLQALDSASDAIGIGDMESSSLYHNRAHRPADVLARIWEPFYPIKYKGTGLGLATTYSVIKKHGVSIDVAPGPDTARRSPLS